MVRVVTKINEHFLIQTMLLLFNTCVGILLINLKGMEFHILVNLILICAAYTAMIFALQSRKIGKYGFNLVNISIFLPAMVGTMLQLVIR